MRNVGLATRAELVAAMSCRYVSGGRDDKARLLGEFAYGDEVRAALVVAEEASDLACGKRLHALLPALFDDARTLRIRDFRSRQST